MCSMGRDPKARNANQGPMATVAVVAAVSMLKNTVAAMSMLANPNPRKRSPHYLQTSVGRCGKARHKKGQICKALELICRNCRIKGHYKKVCMKKSAHLVDVPGNSSDTSPSTLMNLENLFMHKHIQCTGQWHKQE